MNKKHLALLIGGAAVGFGIGMSQKTKVLKPLNAEQADKSNKIAVISYAVGALLIILSINTPKD